MANPIFYVDIIDRCNLQCRTCVRGVHLLPNSAKSMQVPVFKKIVTRAKKEGYYAVGVFNWTEPFLVWTLPEYLSVLRTLGLICHVASNLSLEPRRFLPTIERSLMTGIDYLVVSVSGYSQAVHAVNHVGGRIDWVKNNLGRIAQWKRAGTIRTRIALRLIKFDYNAHEQPALEDYSRSLGIEFEAIDGVGHPRTPVSAYVSEESYLRRLAAASPRPLDLDRVCPLVMDTLSVDSDGDAYLCCACPNFPSLRIGPYLELPREDILAKRHTHPICGSCDLPRRAATKADRLALVAALKRSRFRSLLAAVLKKYL
jgi:hypothetical protein